MSLWTDLENLAMRCKHYDDAVGLDPDAIRALCRRAQEAVDVLSKLAYPKRFVATEDTLTIEVDADDPTGLLISIREALE